jgi:methylthioribose-1-phosphate isomerase
VVADNAAGYLMRTGQVDVVIVGSDRTTARGDVCNKVGTYQKALAAFDNDIPMLVALPVSTIDWHIEEGLDDIEIECRSSDELLWMEGPDSEGEMRRVRSAAPGSPALNYAFDVTPARLVTALVTEHGCIAPDADAMKRLHALSSSTD